MIDVWHGNSTAYPYRSRLPLIDTITNGISWTKSVSTKALGETQTYFAHSRSFATAARISL
jgi:hypothetical protein